MGGFRALSRTLAAATAAKKVGEELLCTKELGADASLLEAELLEMRPPPPTAKQLSWGQTKHEANTLEHKHNVQVDAVIEAQQNLETQQQRLEEVALELAAARSLRDKLAEQEMATIIKAKPPSAD